VKDSIAKAYGLDEDQVHVIAPDVGGGFGPKIDPYPEEGVLPWVARRVGRPVRWTETRSENMVAMGHGRAHLQDVEIGGTRDGKVLAYRLDVLADGGAYAAIGAILPVAMTKMMAPGTYAIPKVDYGVQVVATNTMSTVAYRGAGRPEATAAIERAMDLFAAEIGVDPAEVRRANLIPPDAFPATTPTGATYDNGEYERALDTALSAVGYADLRAEQARRREAGEPVQLGIGVSTYVEITAGPNPVSAEHATVEVLADGSARVLTGTSPHGQGHATSWAMLASDALGIPLDRIEVVHGDTDVIPTGVGTFGSRSLQVGGSAVYTAAGQVVDRARELAAGLLEAAADDVVLDTDAGAFHVAGTPSVSVPWTDVVAAAGDDGLKVGLEFAGDTATFPFGAHVAVVEVDVELGQARLVRILTVDDAGRILNPMLVEGQRHGGIAQGAAQALLEEIRYDEDGNPVTANFADYALISATELPAFELVSMETPTPANPLGAKGIGESGTIGSTPAVQSAVVDALAHLGVRHVDMPTTAERIWRAVAAAAEGDDGTNGDVAGSGFGATSGIDAETAAAIESNPDVGA
jgi:carbon-monoxide dehydrogenase large subunit